MANGCQLKESNRSGCDCSIVISNGKPSCGFCALGTSALTFVVTMTPRIAAGGMNGPSNFTPNQMPTSVESDSARQTRLSGACRRIFFSMRSVFMQPPGCILSESRTTCNRVVAGHAFAFFHRNTEKYPGNRFLTVAAQYD